MTSTHEHVRIFDTTLRDGEQSPGCSMTPQQKVVMARALADLGVDIIETGFPASSQSDREAVALIARELKHTTLAVLSRCLPGDIETSARALEAVAQPRMHVFLSTSPLHREHKLRMSKAQVLDSIATHVAMARRYVDDIEFSPEDGTRTEEDFLHEAVAVAIANGATTINLPDTVGYALPADITRMFAAVAARVGGGVTLSAHNHNDLGLAVANSLAAIAAGARQVECTINGIGERAGNAALEEIVMALEVRSDAFGCRSGVRTSELFPTSRALSAVVGVPVQPNKAIVGDNAFAHEAGIHQDGMVKNPLTYEIMRPESVGQPATRLVLGRHSGLRGLDARCRALGYRLRVDDLRALYTKMIDATDFAKSVDDADLAGLIRELEAPPFDAVGAHMRDSHDDAATRHSRW